MAPAPAPAPVEPVGSGPIAGGGGCGTRSFAPSPQFAVTAIAPSCGSLHGNELVTLTAGRVPADVAVYLGGQPARVLSTSATSIVVSTPRRASAGVVEVRVIGPLGYDVLDGAFTYRDADGAVPAPAPSSGTPAPAPSGPAPTSPPGGSGPTPGGGTPDGSGSFQGLTLVDNGGKVEGFDAGVLGFAATCPATCTGVRR